MSTWKEYEWLKAHGMCTRCLKRPASPGHINCEECRRAQCEAAKRAAWRKSPEEREAIAERKREEHARLRAEGICTSCKKAPAREGRGTCAECAKRAAENSRKNRKKERAERERYHIEQSQGYMP